MTPWGDMARCGVLFDDHDDVGHKVGRDVVDHPNTGVLYRPPRCSVAYSQQDRGEAGSDVGRRHEAGCRVRTQHPGHTLM